MTGHLITGTSLTEMTCSCGHTEPWRTPRGATGPTDSSMDRQAQQHWTDTRGTA